MNKKIKEDIENLQKRVFELEEKMGTKLYYVYFETKSLYNDKYYVDRKGNLGNNPTLVSKDEAEEIKQNFYDSLPDETKESVDRRFERIEVVEWENKNEKEQ